MKEEEDQGKGEGDSFSALRRKKETVKGSPFSFAALALMVRREV